VVRVPHLAAETSRRRRIIRRQDQYVPESVRILITGGAGLLEALIERPVRRLVVASRVSIYGEGEVALA
jgi:nucleoside-diphosphate-sugar epimerase